MKAQLSVRSKNLTEKQMENFMDLGFRFHKISDIFPWKQMGDVETSKQERWMQRGEDVYVSIKGIRDFEKYLLEYGPYIITHPNDKQADIKIVFT